MKKLAFILAFCLLLTLPVCADDDSVSADCAAVMCADTGDMLYEKNADKRMLIASITKIMTAIVVIENEPLDREIIIKPEWSGVEGSSMYIKAGESYTVRELLTGMMLSSGNDAAEALACAVSRDDVSFAARMNAKAAELRLDNSSFRNPHGLDDDEHFSTARDMARLTAYCMENDAFREIVSQKSAVIKGIEYVNHNRLLREYPGCIGVKTGYTMAAGRTLVSCAERNGMRLVCVTLNDPDDWNDHKKLLDDAFESYHIVSYDENNFKLELPVASAVNDRAQASPRQSIKLLAGQDDDIDIRLDAPRILFAGGIKGERVGSLSVFINGTLAAQTDLVYTDDVRIDKTQRKRLHERIFGSLGPYYANGEIK